MTLRWTAEIKGAVEGSAEEAKVVLSSLADDLKAITKKYADMIQTADLASPYLQVDLAPESDESTATAEEEAPAEASDPTPPPPSPESAP